MIAGSSVSTRKRWIARFTALFAVAAVLMIGVSNSFAAGGGATGNTSSASDQYDKPVTVVKGMSATASSTSASATAQPVAASTSSGGTLPFTGVSLIWPAIGAIVLVGFGLMLRRQERKE